MAMKPSSKFERMKLKPSDRMKPRKQMVPAPGPTGGGGAIQKIMPKSPANVNAEKRRARMGAMKKKMGGYGK